MKKGFWIISVCIIIAVAACNKDAQGTTDLTAVSLDPANFINAGLTTPITTVPCTLSDGTVTTCYSITTNNKPSEHTQGPWCPTNINDDKSKGGIWMEGGKVYDVDGAFIKNMSTFYSNATWQMYKSDGTINVTNSKAACQAAARPDVDPTYKNYCVECQPSYGSFTHTFLIPTKPVKLSSSSSIGGMGVVIGTALNGVVFDPPAPTAAILGAFTLAPMDDAGGHVNLNEGYHYHAATGKTKEVAQTDGHAPLIGYAMDGYGMYAQLNQDGKEPTDLDECRGHTDTTRGYHYHVASSGANKFLGCFKGAQGTHTVK
jgi:YHYH protein